MKSILKCAFIAFLLPFVALGICGCYYYHQYDAYPARTQVIEGHGVFFDWYSLDYLVKDLLKEDMQPDSIPDEGSYSQRVWEHGQRIRPYIHDQSKEYFSLHITLNPPTAEPCDFVLVADSVMVRLSQPNGTLPFAGAEQVTENQPSPYVCHSVMAIEPIAIPKGYKEDFRISFVLRIFSSGSTEPIVTKPMNLLVQRHKVWTVWGK